MFSKSKINEPAPKAPEAAKPAAPAAPAAPAQSDFKASAPKPKPPASVLSSDLHITGNIKTTGDIQVEGTVEGDIRAHLLTIGETATGEDRVGVVQLPLPARIGSAGASASRIIAKRSPYRENLPKPRVQPCIRVRPTFTTGSVPNRVRPRPLISEP